MLSLIKDSNLFGTIDNVMVGKDRAVRGHNDARAEAAFDQRALTRPLFVAVQTAFDETSHHRMDDYRIWLILLIFFVFGLILTTAGDVLSTTSGCEDAV
ncbi:MAG: hypothetical protein IPQ00_00015 [Chloracidobacterium sp.]|nr:hypothetical protein [Chloracidobacterium sp.]